MIVIVDDEKDLQEAFVLLLESYDLDVNGFTLQSEANDFINDNKDQVDIVFCDYRMPCGPGTEFLKSLPDQIVACLVTGDRPPSSHAYHIVHKPFKAEEILGFIEQHQKS